MVKPTHHFKITTTWTGNTGKGTSTYKSYSRDHQFTGTNKPALPGSASPEFRGDATRYNPEELLLGSLSACHMLWYLHLCADHNIVVTQYIDAATCVMTLDESGSGKISAGTLNPEIIIENPANLKLAEALHHEAHEKCFIANSVNFPVEIKARITADK